MPTALREHAANDRISDRALTVLTGWLAEIRAADLEQLRPSRTDDDCAAGSNGLAAPATHRLSLRDKARLLAAITMPNCPLEQLPSLMAGLVAHPEADSMVWWQITVGSDTIFKGTDDVIRKTFPHLDRREIPVRRLRLVARALLDGDRRPDTDIANDPDCGEVSYKIVGRIRRVLDTSAADLAAHAAAAYQFVSDERTGGWRTFAAERGIGAKLAQHLLRDARQAEAEGDL